MKEWIWPIVAGLLKLFGAVGALVVLVAGVGSYYAQAFRQEMEAEVRVRVRSECLRPDFVRSDTAARSYDVTESELALIRSQTAQLDRRLTNILDQAEQVETMRVQYTQGTIKPQAGGVGGPAPRKKSKP